MWWSSAQKRQRGPGSPYVPTARAPLRALFYAASIPLLFGFLCCLPRTHGVCA